RSSDLDMALVPLRWYSVTRRPAPSAFRKVEFSLRWSDADSPKRNFTDAPPDSYPRSAADPGFAHPRRPAGSGPAMAAVRTRLVRGARMAPCCTLAGPVALAAGLPRQRAGAADRRTEQRCLGPDLRPAAAQPVYRDQQEPGTDRAFTTGSDPAPYCAVRLRRSRGNRVHQPR